jgi:hypothetical protein
MNIMKTLSSLFIVLVMCLAAARAHAQNAMPASVASIEGAVFVTSSGGPSYVPGAKVTLHGSETSLLEYIVLSAANMSAALWVTGFRPVGLGAAALSEFVEYKHELPQLSRLGMAVQMH